MNFNKQQQEVINTLSGNISVIATAGSGKTTVLVHRIKNLIDNNADQQSILAITFSKKAKENILNRLEELNIHNVHIETFHSFALKIIRMKYPKKYNVWTAQWEKDKVIEEICLSKRLCNEPDIPYNEIFSFIAWQKVHMKSPADDLIYTNNLPFSDKDMQAIYSKYEEIKEDKDYIEFDDFLNMAIDILNKNKQLLSYLKETFKYILVDEYQDVSISQAVLLDMINTGNTMIVGDPLQAIYAFRGGKSEYILNFTTDYPGAKLIHLNTNYRCSKDIVKTANKLADTIPDSKHKDYIESVANASYYKAPEYIRLEDEFEEADYISKKINQLKDKYKMKDIAILSRTNAQLQKVEAVLHENKIAFEVVNGVLFTEQPEIRLIISYLKLAEHNNDNEAFSYVYNKPNRWLSKKFYEEVERNAKRLNLSLYSAMFSIDRRNWRFKSGIDELCEVVNYIQNKKYKNVGEIVKYLRARLNIDEFVTKGKQADDGSFVEQIENLDGFEAICGGYKTIEELLDYLDNLNEDMQCKNMDKVKLSTIHRSKGLEYPVVFIIGCNDDLLPHRLSKDENDEKRLLYVGITRAEKELYLSSTQKYNSKPQKESPFIENIKDTTIEIKNKKQLTENMKKK